MIETFCRAPTVADAASLADVFVSAWQMGFKGLLPQDMLDHLDREESRVRWEADLNPGNTGPARFIVAECRGLVCGFAAFGLSRDPDVAIGTGEVFALHVLPAAWGRGIGRTLLAATLVELGASGSTGACLWVIDQNTRARHFYEHQSWKLDGGLRERSLLRGAIVREIRYRISVVP